MSVPIRVRLSPALQAALDPLSPNTSAAVRALLLVGLHAAGIAITPALQHESAVLALMEELAVPVRVALARMAEREVSYTCRTPVGQLSYTPPVTEGAAVADDPFAAIGIAV